MIFELLKTKEIYAHTKEDSKETLLEHSEKTMLYYEKLSSLYGWDSIIQNLLKEFCFKLKKKTENIFLQPETQNFLFQWFKNSIYYHDTGKINPFFQRDKMGVPLGITGPNRTEHSIFSSLIYLNESFSELKELGLQTREERMTKYLLLSFSYAITKHHGSLGEIIDQKKDNLYIKNLELENNTTYFSFYKDHIDLKKIHSELSKIEKFYDYIQEPEIYYLLVKMCHSILVTCDFYATASFYQEEEQDFHLFDNKLKEKIPTFYENDPILKNYENIKEHPKTKKELLDTEDINDLRWNLLLEAEKNVDDSSIISLLEAPTGGGKTNMSIHLAMQLLQKTSCNKLLYVFPFNTLSEQTKERLDTFFHTEENTEEKVATVVNSITPIMTKESFSNKENTSLFFEQKYLQHQMLDYPVTLISHVQLFDMLFGNTRENQLRFCQLCNSVIVLDEIQTYKQKKWEHIFHMLSTIGKYLNIRFIVMSATLPNFEKLIENVKFNRLMQDSSSYFEHRLFKDRVKPHDIYLDKEYRQTEDVASLCLEIIHKHPGKRILIECISKKMAQELSEILKNSQAISAPVLELTGDDRADYRKNIISMLKEKQKNKDEFTLQSVILVATQVIEAGVDIDMDIGIKDVSLLDSEEQFLGRINRSCLRKDCHAYFFYSGHVKKVYKEDDRAYYNMHENRELFKTLEDKKFSVYYDEILEKIQNRNHTFTVGKNNTSTDMLDFENYLRYGDFINVKKELLLIEQNTFTVFVNQDIEINGKIRKGSELWDAFTNQEYSASGYGKKQIDFSILKNYMQYFTYNFFEKPTLYKEEQNGVFYLENGDPFIKEETIVLGNKTFSYKKFDRLAYEQQSKSDIL